MALKNLPWGDFRGVMLLFIGYVFLYFYSILIYRIFLKIFPLTRGDLKPGSRDEFIAQINILFYLVLFNSWIRTHFIPVPLMRVVYLALGAKLGKNTFSAGAILDPPLTSIGANSIIGHDAVLFSHAIEADRFALEDIKIGDGVTIGAHAIVMAGVKIGDGAVVCAGAVVPKGKIIKAGEIWGGVPAKCLGRIGAVINE